MSTSVQEQPTTETATTPQPGSIVHIEFTTPDLAKAKAFYGELFGWEFHPFMATEWYFQTPKGWGPCGCVMQGEPATDGKTMLYVNVTDIAETLAKAATLGATTAKEKTEIPGGHGFFAHMKAPDGNVWGIYCRS